MSNRNERKARAAARVQRAQARYESAEAAYAAQPAHRIPLGQPILLGHHSQRRHERDLQRLNKAMGNAVQAGRDLAAAEASAAEAGYSIQISDDDAVAALQDKLAAAEAEHAAYLAHNKHTRGGGPVLVSGCTGCYMLARRGETGPLPGYVLANSRKRIASVRQQLAAAQAHAAAVAAAEASGDTDPTLASGDGWTLTHAVTEARVRFTFNGRPDPDTRSLLKGAGFRWAPSAGAWQRQDTANGLAAARALAARL